MMKYSDTFTKWLRDLGYTHCFYVAGGNIMHILESVSNVITCVPVVHEVSAGIAAEYFNELSVNEKAFALVTAGPGLTNVVTAFAGSWLESRELLVIGGQVKSTDLTQGGIRQNGIQEIDGVSIVKSITKSSIRISRPVSQVEVAKVIEAGRSGRKGPVFIEFCLDAQNSEYSETHIPKLADLIQNDEYELSLDLKSKIEKSKRPVLLLGGGIDRKIAQSLSDQLKQIRIPVMTTWNAADRVSSLSENYFGRPNTWGQRYSNILIQQSDLLIAVGTRLGLQQTGFNWQSFVPAGEIIQVDIDKFELSKQNPKVDYRINMDANPFLQSLLKTFHTVTSPTWEEWLSFSKKVKQLCPIVESSNRISNSSFINTYEFYEFLSEHVNPGETLIPSSSGASETVAMQSFSQQKETYIVTNKGLASMGYGLAGAIGAAFATKSRVFHVEGDGGFAQNLQELGTIAAQNLEIKTFILCNDGYASIRMTQQSYFNGHYVGCDSKTLLGLPKWEKICEAYGLPCTILDASNLKSSEVNMALNSRGPHVFLVQVDPNQTYFPKITSTIDDTNQMISNPIHLMTPPLDPAVQREVLKYLK